MQRIPSRASLVGVLAVLVLSCASTTARQSAPRHTDSEKEVEGASSKPRRPERAGDVSAGRLDHERTGGRIADAGEDAAVAGNEGRQAETPATVREAVHAVVAARGGAAYATPNALHAIAGMLEGVAGGASPAAGSIQRMRDETAALARLGATDLDRADRVKSALDHGIEAIRAMARSRAAGWLDRWVDAAATAVSGIDPATPLGLQRAAVQDALRSLADAVLVAAQFGNR